MFPSPHHPRCTVMHLNWSPSINFEMLSSSKGFTKLFDIRCISTLWYFLHTCVLFSMKFLELLYVLTNSMNNILTLIADGSSFSLSKTRSTYFWIFATVGCHSCFFLQWKIDYPLTYSKTKNFVFIVSIYWNDSLTSAKIW